MLELKTVEEARKILGKIKLMGAETIEVTKSLDRFVATDIISSEDLPPFDKSMMDGYAVKAEDTFGASEENPVSLSLAGEVRIGEVPKKEVKKGEAIKINTGAMMPKGANSVEMLEYTEIKGRGVELQKALTPSENIAKRGEDIKKEEVLLATGHRIRAQDIGALSGLGITEIKVFKRPKVAIIPTGDELIEPKRKPESGQIRDMNTYSLSAQIRKCGGEPVPFEIIKDNPRILKEKIKEALSKADMVLISGGSSVGTYDLTLKVMSSLTQGKVLTQGVAIKPGKPTIIAKVREKIVFGLPGNPASVMIVFRKIVEPTILAMMNAKEKIKVVSARLTRTVTSSTGREEFIRVRLETPRRQKDRQDAKGLIAIPLHRGSANIVSLVKADGLLKIPRLSEGIEKGQMVEVELWD
ncbi:molybdopterin molybdotransferase MoeA [bacterium]|nr:molybdopterin molybdotransferase MoeA [bacterium]MCG2675982.1 molybdopterin molybdotransferase MoeA [bacterium]